MRFRYLAVPSLLGILALLVFILPGATATDYYVPGDLVVSVDETRNNDTIDIVGSVIIQTGVAVSWADVQVNFNSTAATSHGFYIDGAAQFLRVNITALTNTTRWWFRINGTGALSAQQCDFGWMNGTGADPGSGGTAATSNFGSLVGGVQIYSSTVYIGNSSIHDGLGTNVYIQNAAPRIDRTHIFDANYLLYEYATSYSAPRQTSDYRAVAVCVMLASGAADLDRDRIERCGSWASANATDLGSSGATAATSNLRLVGAGVVSLSGTHSLRLLEIQNITTVTPATRTFNLGPVAVTHNLIKIASWGELFKNTASAVVGGGYLASADVGMEIYQDPTYAAGAANYDIYALTINGSYWSGIVASFTGHAAGVTLSVDSCTFASGGTVAAVAVRFASLSAAHSASITALSIDLNTAAATGISVDDVASSGKPTITVSSNSVTHARAPVSIGLQLLTGGASVTANSNNMDNTAGASNGSATPSTRGGIDIRWVSLSGGALAVTADNNKVYNQTWQALTNDGITLYSSATSNLQTSIAIRNNDVSNVTDGIWIYENNGGSAMNGVYNITGNTVEVANTYGIRVDANSNAGSLDPAFDKNTIDRAQSYALFWTVSSAIVAQRTFGNNTVYGTGTSRCCGMSFQYGVVTKWPLIIADSLVFNTSYGLMFSQIIANIYRTDVTGNNNGTQCQDCVAHFYESQIYSLSAQVSGAQAEVISYLRFGSPRVQWQGDGGILIHGTNLQMDWVGPGGIQRLAIMPIDAAGQVANRTLAAWKKTQTLGDIYSPLVPSIRVGLDDITGNSLAFVTSFWGNITIIDGGYPVLSVTTPQAGAQLRVRSATVKGLVTDLLTGVEMVQVAIDGINFTNVTKLDRNLSTWETVVTFPADGVYTIGVKAWDQARWAITFGDYSSGFLLINITGVVIDTQAPRLQITDPAIDLTTRLTSYVVHGIVNDTNTIDTFQFSFKGQNLPILPDMFGNFQGVVSNLSEGPNLITVLATDRAGNTNVTTRTIVLDTVPPHLNVFQPLNSSFTNRPSVDINGEVEQGVRLTINDLDATFPYAATLKTGLNKIWINATDRGNNTESYQLWVTLDKTSPIITFTSPSRFPFYTRDPHVTIQGSSNEALATLVVNGVTYPLVGNAPTSFSFELYLEDGQWTVLVHVTDLANNTEEKNASPLVVDTQPPSLRIDSPSDKSVTPARGLSFRGRTDPNAFLNVTKDLVDTPWDINPVTGEFTYTDTRVSDGVFQYVFRATDAVGNVRSITMTITVDTTKPALEVLSPPATYRTEEAIVNFHGTVAAGSLLTMTVDSTDDSLDQESVPVAIACPEPVGSDCRYNFDLMMSEGQTQIKLVATDQAGNLQARDVFVQRTVEAVAPPPQNAPYLAIIGVVIGLATLPIWISRYRSKADTDEPGLLKKKEAPARSMMPAPARQPEVIVQDEPHDMYAQDAMARRPSVRPPREG
jgi:hypothetical protein